MSLFLGSACVRSRAAGSRYGPTLADLEGLVSRYRRRRSRLLAQRIASGRRTTWQYRQWCDGAGCSWADGALRAQAPWPFPFADAVSCGRCGLVVERAELDSDPEFTVRTLGGCSGHIDQWIPDEFEQVCPECGARQSFQRTIRCAACDSYPCICADDDFIDAERTDPASL